APSRDTTPGHSKEVFSFLPVFRKARSSNGNGAGDMGPQRPPRTHEHGEVPTTRTRGPSVCAGEPGSPQHSEGHLTHEAARALRRREGIKPVAGGGGRRRRAFRPGDGGNRPQAPGNRPGVAWARSRP